MTRMLLAASAAALFATGAMACEWSNKTTAKAGNMTVAMITPDLQPASVETLTAGVRIDPVPAPVIEAETVLLLPLPAEGEEAAE